MATKHTRNAHQTQPEAQPQTEAQPVAIPNPDALRCVYGAPRFEPKRADSKRGGWLRNAPSAGVRVDAIDGALRIDRNLVPCERPGFVGPSMPSAERAPIIGGTARIDWTPPTGIDPDALVGLVVALLVGAGVPAIDQRAVREAERAESERKARAALDTLPDTLGSALDTIARGPTSAGYLVRAALFVDNGAGAPACDMLRAFVGAGRALPDGFAARIDAARSALGSGPIDALVGAGLAECSALVTQTQTQPEAQPEAQTH